MEKNLIQLFDGQSSKSRLDSIKDILIQKPALIHEVFELAFNRDDKAAWHAAWVLDGITDDYPEWITPYFDRIIRSLPEFHTDGQKRHMLKLVLKHPLPQDEDLLGILCKFCFDCLEDQSEAIAIRVHCMSILFEISKIFPEIKQELHDLIIMQYDEASPGFQNRAMKILPRL